MTTAFLIFRKLFILCVFFAACSTATSPWQRVVVSGLGLIYISIVSNSSVMLSKITGAQVLTRSDPGFAEHVVNLIYVDVFAFVAAVQIFVAAID